MGIQIGDILGDYQVTGVLGRGGMGKVFRVRSLITDREEAMKVVLPDLDENPALADRFLREIKIHASLRHPNIAALNAGLRIEGRLVMVLELVNGISLEDKLRDGAIDATTALGYTRQVISALAFAHERGVIHRDIKPANILIASDGVVKLTDFGIARSEAAARLTGTGLAVGTLAYMSPEQIRSEDVDARSDIYSLGLTLYEMVTGRRAIQADTEHALIEAQLGAMPPDPAVLNALVPSHVSGAIMRAISKQPARRFQAASEFGAALENAEPNAVPAAAGASTPAAPELAELETRLSRVVGPIARRLVADAARHHSSIDAVRQALAAEIEDPAERARFLKTDPGAGTATLLRPPAPVTSCDAATLDRLSQALAPYLGPIARVLVGRAARSARNLEELRNKLAAEIPSGEDRARFLAAVR